MKRGFTVALVLAGCLTAGLQVHAQSQAGGNGTGPGQSKPAGAQAGQPAAQQPGQQTGGNAFPEDTSKVPVLPEKTAPALPEGSNSGADSGAGGERVGLPNDDNDPVRSPDDPAVAPAGESDSGSSSSLAGIDKLLPGPDDEKADKKGKLAVKEPTHKEAASKDIEVGGYYLETKNWKAAESRFESAMVLDPDNPDVFWGLAEAERHLGAFADAKKYYQTVLDYDPESKHGKEARKALKEPEIVNAKAAQPAGDGVKQ